MEHIFSWHVFLLARFPVTPQWSFEISNLGEGFILGGHAPFNFLCENLATKRFLELPKNKKNGSSKAWFFTANKVVSKISTFNYGAWINIKKIKNGHIIHFRMHLHIF